MFAGLRSIAKAIGLYKAWRMHLPPLEKTHEKYKNIDVVTSMDENLIVINETDNDIIVFTCVTNHQSFCNVEEIFMDGTFKCCSVYFCKFYTIHGYKNGNYVALSLYSKSISGIINFCIQMG